MLAGATVSSALYSQFGNCSVWNHKHITPISLHVSTFHTLYPWLTRYILCFCFQWCHCMSAVIVFTKQIVIFSSFVSVYFAVKACFFISHMDGVYVSFSTICGGFQEGPDFKTQTFRSHEAAELGQDPESKHVQTVKRKASLHFYFCLYFPLHK